MSFGRNLFAALALLLVLPVRGAAPTGATAAIERLRQFLPGVEAVPEPALRDAVPSRYTGKHSLTLMPDGRYVFFQWSETGPVTRDHDLGEWTIRDGWIEVQPNAANAVLRDAPGRYLFVKLLGRGRPQLYLVEAGQVDLLLAAEENLRKAWAEKGGDLASEEGQSAAQSLLGREYGLRGWSSGGATLLSRGLVAAEQNRAAAARPRPASPLLDFVARARQFVPTIAPAVVRRAGELAGSYASNWLTAGQRLYLLPDGTYYYVRHFDIPTIDPTYDHGTWSFRDGVVELKDALAGMPGYDHPGETRFFVVRAPAYVRDQPRYVEKLQLVGTTGSASTFLDRGTERAAAELADKQSGRPAPDYPDVGFGVTEPLHLYSLTLDTAISAREGTKLRQEFDAANARVATDRRLRTDFNFKSESSAGSAEDTYTIESFDFGRKGLGYEGKYELTIDGIRFFCTKLEPNAGATILKLSGSVRAEANNQIQTLRGTTLYLDGTRLTGASPRFEVGGRTISEPPKRR